MSDFIHRVHVGDSLTRTAAARRASSRSSTAGAAKSLIVVDLLPRTSTGKIQKNRLREEHARHDGA